MKYIKFLFSIIFILIFTTTIQAQIAVFPFEDLSKDINGLDLDISTSIAKKLIDFGYDVIFPIEIILFLEKNNTPFIGWIDIITARKIKKKFGVRLILLGTVLEKSEKKSELAISVRLLSMPEYKLIWGKTFNFKKSKNITILNLKPKNWDEIIDFSITELLWDLPEIVLTKAISHPDIDVDNIFINPRYAKSGEKINLKASLKFSSVKPDYCILVYSPNNKKEIKIKDKYLNFTWNAPNKENRYPVTLKCFWKKPVKFKKKIFLSTYFVDNTPPKLNLIIKHATKINNKFYFSKFIKLIPHLKTNEKLSKWDFKIVYKKDNKTVIEMRNYGKLPTYLIWKGITVKGAVLPNGEYILNLAIWDKAGNKSEQKKEVYLVKTISPPDIKAYSMDNQTIIKFLIKKHPIKINYFRIELYDSSGRLIAYKLYEKKVNKVIELKFNKKFKKIFYSIDIRDRLGNRLIQKKIPLDIKIKEKKIIKQRKIWINEF